MSTNHIIEALERGEKLLIEKIADVERLQQENKQLRSAIEGLLMEWDKLTRYGSPMAKDANERVMAARKMLLRVVE